MESDISVLPFKRGSLAALALLLNEKAASSPGATFLVNSDTGAELGNQ